MSISLRLLLLSSHLPAGDQLSLQLRYHSSCNESGISSAAYLHPIYHECNEHQDTWLESVFGLASDSPFIFFIGTNKTVSENYGDSVDFEGLRKQGWAYSKINESELLYADELSAMVDINFSRLNKDEEVLSATDATYLLVYKEGSWLLKAGFINSNLSLGK